MECLGCRGGYINPPCYKISNLPTNDTALALDFIFPSSYTMTMAMTTTNTTTKTKMKKELTAAASTLWKDAEEIADLIA